MGNYVNNGVVTLEGSVDYDDAVREIATLVGVGRRGDGDRYAGRFVSADVCVAQGINKWARHKPLVYYTPIIPNSLYSQHQEGTDADGNIGGLMCSRVYCYGSDLYAMTYVPSFQTLEYRKPHSYYKRIKDFNGYKHSAFWENTGYNPITIGSLQGNTLGSSIRFTLSLGIPDDPDKILTGADITRALGLYAGVLFVRENASSSLGSSHFNGKDYLVITTERPLLSYMSGETIKDSNNLVTVQKTASGIMIDLAFKIPTEADLTNIEAAFDNWIGKTITVYPIMSSEPVAFLDNFNHNAKVTKLALNANSWPSSTFTLRQATSSSFVEPTLSVDFSVSASASSNAEFVALASFNNLVGIVTGNQPYTATYSVNVTAMRIKAYKWNGSEWVFIGYGGGEWGETVTVSYKGESRTLDYKPSFAYPLPSTGRYKFEGYLEAIVTYNNTTHDVVGKITTKELTY
jgi:hypothetical protein